MKKYEKESKGAIHCSCSEVFEVVFFQHAIVFIV